MTDGNKGEVKTQLTCVACDEDQHQSYHQCRRGWCSAWLPMTLLTTSWRLLGVSSVNNWTQTDRRTCWSWRHRGNVTGQLATARLPTTWHLLSLTDDAPHAARLLAAAAALPSTLTSIIITGRRCAHSSGVLASRWRIHLAQVTTSTTLPRPDNLHVWGYEPMFCDIDRGHWTRCWSCSSCRL